MFELDQAIIEWRRQLAVGGIKSATTLDELESHLRGDIERLTESGADPYKAFETASRRIGAVGALGEEFSKTKNFWSSVKLGGINVVLGALWLVGCLWSFGSMLRQSRPPDVSGASLDTRLVLLMNLLAILIYLFGMVGSLLLILGARWGREITRTVALLFFIACLGQVMNFRMSAVWREWCGVVAVFSVVSIALLHTAQTASTNSETSAN